MLGKFREVYPCDAWIVLGSVWGFAVVGVILNVIDMHRFKAFSLICQIGMGSLPLFIITQFIEVFGSTFFLLIALGGFCYAFGLFFYLKGKRKKFMHSVFHIFVNVAFILHAVAIVVYVMPG
jgi:hemolysin III